MKILDNETLRKKSITEIEKIIAALKDKRDEEAWSMCVQLGAAYLGVTAARDLLSDKKSNQDFLEKIKEIIRLIEAHEIKQAEKLSDKLLIKVTSSEYIHSKITFLVHKLHTYFEKGEDVSVEDLRKDLSEISVEIKSPLH